MKRLFFVSPLFFLFPAFVFFVISLSSCKHEPSLVYASPDPSCDTTDVSYSAQVKPILDANCIGCHNSSASKNFDGYAQISAYLAGNASLFISNINYTGPQPMPPTGRLDTCSVRQCILWVQSGYPNN
jgi:hypothetical protein